MFLTVDILKARKACRKGIQFFERAYPNGAELKDVITNPNTPREMLHWGYIYLDATPEEIALYEAACSIKNSTRYYESERIEDSDGILRSTNVVGSQNVERSDRITDSSNIALSTDVDTSKSVFDSKIVLNSQDVYGSINVSGSNTVFNSKYITDSNTVCESSTITNSTVIYNSQWIDQSNFLMKCAQVDHSMFCLGISNQSYMLFNKPISETIYKNIEEQYNRFLRPYLPLKLVEVKNDIGAHSARQNFNPKVLYASVPPQAWEWVKTLPNYDGMLMYKITYNPIFY